VCSISTLEGQFGVETILFFGSVGCASAPAGCQNSGINNTETMAINAFGWGPQVGFANYMNLDAPTYEAPAPPIPEPASLVMLAGGIGCCITRLRRRK
jgi:hypothetical protein